MTIVSDIDGVLAQFESAWEPILSKLAGGSKLPKGWQDDPEFPAIWDWDVTAYGKELVKVGWEHVGKSNDFWLSLKPSPGVGLEIGKQFNRLQRNHDVFFMTSRSGVGVQRQTCQWLYDNLGINYPNVIVVNNYQDKWTLLENLKAKWFVDDKLETVQGWYDYCYKAGIRPSQHYFALIDAPYNRQGRTVKGMRIASNIEAALKESGLWG